jgi:hypothetical protein
MKKSEILALIKEEVEVVLTDNEMIEFFDLDPAKLLDEMMLDEQEGLDIKDLGKDRETGSARKQRFRGAAADAGAQKGVTPQESGMLKMILGVLENIAKTDDLKKFRPVLIPLLKKLQQRSKGAGGPGLAEDKDWIQKAVNPDHEGYCTPMTKSTCTPPRKALAKRFKKAGRKKDKDGGSGWQGKV